MGYKLEQVEAIAAKLRELPAIEPPPKDLNKKEVVKLLSKEIRALQKRGYTLEQIATSLKGEGLDISTYTLKSYMNKSKQIGKSGGGVKSLPGSSPAGSQPQLVKGVESNRSDGDGAAEGAAKTAKVEKDEKAEQPQAGKTNYVSRSKLAPKPDSDDL